MDDCAAEPLLLDPAPGDQIMRSRRRRVLMMMMMVKMEIDDDDDDKNEDGDKDEYDDNCMVEFVKFTEVAM